MVSGLLVVGLVVAAFVSYNIGGSNIGVAFGPAVGANAVSQIGAAALMTVSFFVGAWTLGRGVVATMGGRIVPSGEFTLLASVVVLFFIGLALFLANVVGVPASTSMTGVGSIAGLGLGTRTLNWATMGEILSWWIVSPVLAFWVSAVVGRYLYSRLAGWFDPRQDGGGVFELDDGRAVPTPRLKEGVTVKEAVGTYAVVGVGCYVAFSAGASNAANAIAPLVGSGTLALEPGLLLVGAAVSLGAFTIGRRTLATMGSELTEMPLLAALIVASVSSTIVAVLSALDIPVSVVVISTMSIVGLGWGRASRHGDSAELSTGGLAAGETGTTIGGEGTRPHPDGAGDGADVPPTSELFDPEASARVILAQNLVPVVATASTFLIFRYVI